MTQPTINDLTIKKVDRVMEEAVWLDDSYIGSLLYDWRSTYITAWPRHLRSNKSRTFFSRNMDQAKQYLIDEHLKNRED